MFACFCAGVSRRTAGAYAYRRISTITCGRTVVKRTPGVGGRTRVAVSLARQRTMPGALDVMRTRIHLRTRRYRISRSEHEYSARYAAYQFFCCRNCKRDRRTPAHAGQCVAHVNTLGRVHSNKHR